MSADVDTAALSGPAEEHHADLVVVGGGISGTCAAICAARAGIEVAIVHERPVFGGSGSSEIRVPVSGAASSNAWSAEGGLIHEILLTDRATNPTGPRPTTVHLDLLLDDYLEREPGLTVHRSTLVTEVETAADGRIDAVVAAQLGSERRLRLHAGQFVDATGDGTIAALAGARTRYGRESRAEHGESLAPLRADDSSLGSTITMQARRMGRPVPFRAPDWAIDYTGAGLTFDRTTPRLDGDVLSGFWWVEVNDPFHQIHDNQVIRRQLHRHVLGLWDFLKNRSDRREELADFHLEWIGQVPGKRESRRVMGDVILTQHDVVDPTRWEDEIGTAGWWIDLHTKGGVENCDAPAERENVDLFYRGIARVAPFSVPLRACYSADVANLWTTGRCISASHVGLGPIRVQQSLGQLGQSVGTAAALAIDRRSTPRELANDPAAVDLLQRRILRDGVRLLHTPNTDPEDLALRARAAGEAQPLMMPSEASRWLPIGDGSAQVIPEFGSAEDRLLSLRLRNPGRAAARVRVVAEPITTIWDRPAGDGTELARLHLEGEQEGWFEVDWPAPPVGRPVRLAVYPAGASPRGASGTEVEWAAADGGAPTGTLSEMLIVAPGGPEPHNARLEAFSPAEIEIPAYRLWRQRRRCTQLMRLDPPARPYEPANAVNGWAWPGRGANLWVSPPRLPASIDLLWPEPMRIGQVQLAFDTDLDTSTDQRPGLHRPSECAESFRIELRQDGTWETVAEVTGNYLRRRVVGFTPRDADALRVVITATGGDPSGRIYEIRAYAEGGPAPSSRLDRRGGEEGLA